MKKTNTIRTYAVIFLTVVTITLFAANFYIIYSYPMKFKDEVSRHSTSYNVDQAMVYSIIRAESTFNPLAISPAGAIGLMQLMPATAQMLASDLKIDGFTTQMLYDPEINIRLGVSYYDRLLKKFQNTYTALAAYNAGEGNVTAWLNNPQYSSDGKTFKIIPYKETSDYIKKIKKNYRVYNNRLK